MPGDNVGQKILSKESVDMCLSSLSPLLSLHTYKKRRWREETHHHPLKKMQPAMIFFQSCNSYLKEFQKKNFQSDYIVPS